MRLTVWILTIAVFLVAIIDIYLLVTQGPEATISSVLYTYAQRYPVIAFVLGGIAGHLFWPNP